MKKALSLLLLTLAGFAILSTDSAAQLRVEEAQIERARSTLAEAFASEDYDLRTEAIFASGRFLGDAAVADALSRGVFSEPLWSDLVYQVRLVLKGLDGEAHQAARGTLKTRTLEALRAAEVFDANDPAGRFKALRQMALLLGETSEPGGGNNDGGAVEATRDLEVRLLALESPEDTEWYRQRFHDERQRAIEALHFARIRLGDGKAFDAYAAAARAGDREARVRRLERLGDLPASHGALSLALDLLGDTEPILDASPSHSTVERSRSARDFALDALAAWFDDFPVTSHPWKVYSDSEAATARDWLVERLQSLP